MGTDPGTEGPRGRAGAHAVQAEPVAQRAVGCPRSPLHRLRDSCCTFSSSTCPSIGSIHPSSIQPPVRPFSQVPLPGGPRHSLCSSEPGCDPASHRRETQRTPWPQQELSTHLGSHGRWAPPGGLRAVLQGDSDVPRARRPGPCAAPLRRLSAGGRHLPPLPWAGGGRGIHTAPGTAALQNLTGSPSPAHGSGVCEVAPSRGRA